jgi:hypothetical protein
MYTYRYIQTHIYIYIYIHIQTGRQCRTRRTHNCLFMNVSNCTYCIKNRIWALLWSEFIFSYMYISMNICIYSYLYSSFSVYIYVDICNFSYIHTSPYVQCLENIFQYPSMIIILNILHHIQVGERLCTWNTKTSDPTWEKRGTHDLL